jgi:hypothetical protein
MTATASNLTDAHYGYDMVCATTQDSINATMKEFLSPFHGQAFSACYVFNPVTRQKEQRPLSAIAAAIGGDPFSIPDGADQSNPLVSKLFEDCKFLYAFQARMGLPAGIAPAAMPDIIRLDKGNERVTYQLYCSEFSVIVLNQEFGSLSLTNLQQPGDSPWLFEFELDLDLRNNPNTSFGQLPQEAQDRIKNIDPGSMFSVQQLYLDLNSKGLQQMPSISGLDPTSEAYVDLTRIFINQYWDKLGQSDVVLGYTVQPSTTGNLPPSVVPTDFNFEISPYLDAQGNANGQYGLYTLNYLIMSQNRALPPPVPFSWNWIETSEAADYHGAMAIRRDIFLDYTLGLVNQNIGQLCIDTNVELHHSGESYSWRYWAQPSPWPTSFQKVASPGTSTDDSMVQVMTIAFDKQSYDDSMASSHLSSINGTYNYSLSGGVSIGGNKIQITLHSVLYVEAVTHEAGIRHFIVSGNALDLTHVTTYEISVDANGELQVNASSTDSGGAQSLDYGDDGLMSGLGDLKDGITNEANQIAAAVSSMMTNFGDSLRDMINQSSAWVFPGGKTFAFKAAGFSSGLDLITHVTYVDPS